MIDDDDVGGDGNDIDDDDDDDDDDDNDICYDENDELKDGKVNVEIEKNGAYMYLLYIR